MPSFNPSLNHWLHLDLYGRFRRIMEAALIFNKGANLLARALISSAAGRKKGLEFGQIFSNVAMTHSAAPGSSQVEPKVRIGA